MSNMVSVILPIYKVEKYINKAVNSVLNQTYKNLEIILVDDGSPDNCGKICDDYAKKDKRVKVVHKKNGGLASARNAGINIANGDWIYFMDSDDWIELNTIEKTINFAAKNNCDMCLFDFDTCYGNLKMPRTALKHEENVFTALNDKNVFIAYACAGGFAWNYIAKANIIKQLRFDEEFSIYEDQTFKWQLYEKIASFCYLKETFYHYRYVLKSLSNSSDYDIELRFKSLDRIYAIGCEIVSKNGFPANAVKAVHSKYLECFWNRCVLIFRSKKTLSEKISLYKALVTSNEFTESIQNFTDLYFSNVSKILLKKGKVPCWILVWILVKIYVIRNILRLKKYGVE